MCFENDAEIISGDALMQYFSVFSFNVDNIRVFFLRNDANIIPTNIDNRLSTPTRVIVLPDFFKILKKGPRSNGCDVSVIFAPILKK